MNNKAAKTHIKLTMMMMMTIRVLSREGKEARAVRFNKEAELVEKGCSSDEEDGGSCGSWLLSQETSEESFWKIYVA